MATDTVGQLRQDALWIAGEDPTNTTGAYYTRVLDYLDVVQDALLTGGSLRRRNEVGANIDLPLVDWRWAKAQPRRTLTLRPKFTNAALTATVATGSGTVNFSGAGPSTNLDGYRLELPGRQDRPQLVSHPSAAQYVLDHTWQEPPLVTTAWSAWQVEYQLADDILRLGAGLIHPNSPPEIEIVDRRTLEDAYPFYRVAEGTPVVAALVAENWLRLSHYPAATLVVELDAIIRPAALSTLGDSGEPTVPKPYRRILSLGAAMLIALDKADEQKGSRTFEEFQSAWLACKAANDRPQHRAARGYGRIKPRQDQRGLRVRTTVSGLPVLW